MLFDGCAECRRCCHVDAGYPALDITLTKTEKKLYKSVCIETSCKHLGSAGCSLGDAKPFSCKLYPLTYNPTSRDFFYDIECPLMPEYSRQLGDPASDASLHLSLVSAEIKRLHKSDSQFLKNNFAVDIDYFELKKLPVCGVD